MWSMRQDDDDRRGRHVVAALNVQLVFVTRYRRGVLTSEHLGTLGEVFASVCTNFGDELVELNGEDDHVHLLVAYSPHVAVARLVNALKGVSARRLRQRYRCVPTGAPVVAVVLRRVGRWRSTGDAQAVHPPAAHRELAGLAPP
jgi:putative transposase